MKRFNLSETAADLKIKLKINKFFGEASFTSNANIAPGTCIPVLKTNNDNEIYLHTMKWGIKIFENSYNLTHIARSEGIFDNQAWGPLIENNNTAVIVCKGFYLWHNTEVLDPVNRRKKTDRQPYYISPNKSIEGEFFYIAALYKERRHNLGRSFSVVEISQSVDNDNNYCPYVQRIPLFLRRNDIHNWLNAKNIANIFNNKHKIKTNPFLKVGLWVNFPEEKEYRDEKTVLQSRFDWDLENEAKIIGLECDKSNDLNIDFDLIEKEALKQNEARKMGVEYNKDNWDNLQNVNNELSDEDKELKQEEYINNTMDNQYQFNDDDDDEEENDNENNKKKRRYEKNSDEEDDDDGDGINEPPHKKQRMNDTLIRRHSINIDTGGSEKINDQNKRSQAH